MFRFITLAAVSKDEQIDRASIPSQLEITRATGERLGGTFVNQYIIDGYSRTAYYNLDDALADIPPLKECINAIGSYDVLIVKNFDRLGSLGMLLYYFFNQYRKQLYSVQQATQIQDPDTYNPSSDISVPSMIISASQNQVYRIAKIADAFEVGTKKRVSSGYFARRVPFGYVRKDKYNVELVPNVAQLLQQFPVMFLEGKSIHKIVKFANDSGIPAAKGGKWNPSPVINILRNPFYSGKVYYERGTRKGGVYKLHSSVEVFDGKHEPIWSYETHLQILDEFKRRAIYPAPKKDYNFSGLLKCSECGHSLWVAYDSYKETRRYWMCPNKHVYISAKKVEKLICDELVKLFSSDAVVPNPDAPSATDYSQRELTALRRQMTRLEQAYESGAYTVEEFAAKRKAYKAREAELLDAERQKAEAERHAVERAEVVVRMRDLIPYLPAWLAEQDPATVRFHLSRAVRMVVRPDKTVEVSLL